MKKTISLILSFALVVSVLCIPAFSAEESDAVTTEQLELLAAFGIVDDSVENSETDASVTRAEAAEYFCKLLDVSAVAASDYESIYYDVTSETPYYGYIKGISYMGYMIGYPDGRFRPATSISVKEAARVLANILGYEDYIAVTSFENVLLKTELLDGVEISDEVTRGELLRMIYNALHAPACKIVGMGNNVSYKMTDDYLGMEHIRGIALNRAVVDAVPGTGLDEINKTLKKNTVSIDGKVHSYDGDASGLLGYRVKYYYKTNTDGKAVVFMTKDEKNNETVLNYDQITGYSNFTYSYQKNNSDKRVKLPSSVSIIFNGGAYPTASDEDMVPKFGKVTLVDNDGDKVIDVVLIDSVEFVLVESTNIEKAKIFAALDGTDLELEDADELIITKDGADYAFDRIINRDLLAVRRTKTESGYDKAVLEVVKEAKANVILGAVYSEKVSVSGTEYPIWDSIAASSAAELKVGAAVTLFTYKDIVVMVEPSGSMDSYGYLVDVSEPELFEDTVQFRLMQTNLTAVTLDMNKTVKIDGVPRKAADIKGILAGTAALSAKPPASGEVAQPVKYTLSSDGKLTALDTLYFNAEKEDAETSLRRLSTEQYKYSRTGSGFYNKDTGAFVAATKDNKAYRVPYRNRYAEENYESYNLAEGMFLNLSTVDYDYVDVCNVDSDSCIAEFVYVYRLVYSTGTYGAFIIQDKIQQLDDEGNVKNVLEVVNAASGASQTLVVNGTMDASYEELNEGDFIRITTNLKGEVIGISGPFAGTMPSLSTPTSKRVYKLGNGNHSTTNPPYADGECMVLGTALNVSQGKLLITTCLASDTGAFDGTVGRDSLPLTSAKIIVMENIRGDVTFKEGSVDDIQTYTDDPENASVVAVYISGGVVRTVFVRK